MISSANFSIKQVNDDDASVYTSFLQNFSGVQQLVNVFATALHVSTYVLNSIIYMSTSCISIIIFGVFALKDIIKRAKI